MFRTDEDGMQYVLSLLKGPAWRLCVTRVPSDMAGRCHNPFNSAENMIQELKDRFGQLNTEGDAWTALQSLHQGPTQSFGDFHLKYMETVEYRTQILYMSDVQGMHLLETKLNETYLLKFADAHACHSTKDIVARLLHLDTQLKKVKALLASSSSASGNHHRLLPSFW